MQPSESANRDWYDSARICSLVRFLLWLFARSETMCFQRKVASLSSRKGTGTNNAAPIRREWYMTENIRQAPPLPSRPLPKSSHASPILSSCCDRYTTAGPHVDVPHICG